jgi:hypothetical protein
VSVLKVKVVTNATPKALKHVANAQHAASVQSVESATWSNAVKVVAAKAVAHAKNAIAVAVVKVAMQKAVTPRVKQPSTTTHLLKPKQKHAPKHATNAWPAKSAAKAPKAATSNASLAVNAQSAANVMRVAKAVANAVHAANVMRVAVNAPLA